MQMCHQLCTLQISDYIFSPLGGQGQRNINKRRNIICQSLMRIYPSDFQNSISKRHRVENCPRAEGEGKRCNGATTVQKLQEMTGLCARANYLESFSICSRRVNLVMEILGKLLFNLHKDLIRVKAGFTSVPLLQYFVFQATFRHWLAQRFQNEFREERF